MEDSEFFIELLEETNMLQQNRLTNAILVSILQNLEMIRDEIK